MKQLFETLGEEPPALPGVYQFLDDSGVTIYVGKAVNLKRRLLQYTVPSRKRKGRKARTIVKAAHSLKWEIASDELEALERELNLIQTLRPRFNVAGAYSFLYPFIGVSALSSNALGDCEITFTTSLEQNRPYAMYGVFRSRQDTIATYEALTSLIAYFAHRNKRGRQEKLQDKPYSAYACYRQMPQSMLKGLHSFFQGDGTWLKTLALELLERPQACRDAALVQDWLMTLEQFLSSEIRPLLDVLRSQNIAQPLSQESRDHAFLRHRSAESDAALR